MPIRLLRACILVTACATFAATLPIAIVMDAASALACLGIMLVCGLVYMSTDD